MFNMGKKADKVRKAILENKSRHVLAAVIIARAKAEIGDTWRLAATAQYMRVANTSIANAKAIIAEMSDS